MLFPRLFTAALFFAGAGCCIQCNPNDDLRGARARTPDGGTTLAIIEATPGCTLTIDGKPWRLPLGVAGPVKPGLHTVSCSNTGESIDVDAPAGYASTLDYWGP
ncbi:MAG: hypothetical protein Q8N23_29575 [Archangium sp.]|nr:hypothetical protein [Archangium sp.]MDP3156857.1 hypothetical protein [Archangium sp.]MDP3575534.1 hypothetical protein [Archangium sp.]